MSDGNASGGLRRRLASIPVGNGLEAAIWLDPRRGVYWTAGVRAWPTPAASPLASQLVAVPAGVVAAGELAPGASTVTLTAPEKPKALSIAGGHYIALLPPACIDHYVFAVSKDANGKILSWPVPHEINRVRAPESHRQCPACESDRWDIVECLVPMGTGGERSSARVCSACGWHGGDWKPTGDAATDENELAADEIPVSQLIAEAAFPVIGIASEAVIATGWARYRRDAGGLTSIALRYEACDAPALQLVVSTEPRTAVRGDGPDEARATLKAAVIERMWRNLLEEGPDGSRRSLVVDLEAQIASIAPSMNVVEVGPLPLEVDGRSVKFSTATYEGLSCSVAWIRGVRVQVVGPADMVPELRLAVMN